MSDNPGYYERLIHNFVEYPNPHFNQIELDIKRTFPEDPFFAEKSTLDSLRNILTAFSKRNLSVGYCQGMNFIGAILIKYLSEEEAFWVLTQLIETILPLDYYDSMAGVLID